MQEVSVIIPNFNGMAYLDGLEKRARTETEAWKKTFSFLKK